MCASNLFTAYVNRYRLCTSSSVHSPLDTRHGAGLSPGLPAEILINVLFKALTARAQEATP